MEQRVDYQKFHRTLFSGSNVSRDATETKELLAKLGISESYKPIDLAKNFADIFEGVLLFDKGQKFKDRPAQISVLLNLWQAVHEYPEETRSSFSKSHLNSERTIIELRIRLSSRMFFYGRRVLFNYKNTRDAIANFEQAIDLFDLGDAELVVLNDFSRMRLFGMRGTAKLFLGRLVKKDVAFWEDAYDDLWRSFELGNQGKEAVKSLRDIALRSLDLRKSDDFFEHFKSLLKLSQEYDHQFYSDKALYCQYRISQLITDEKIDIALEFCNQGLECCESAIKVAENLAETAVSRNNRAFFNQIKIQQSFEIDEGHEQEQLARIIDDLEFAYDYKLGGAALPLALLRRSFLHKKDDEIAFAVADLEQCVGRLALIDDDQVKIRISNNAQASLLEIQLSKFTDEQNLDAVLATVNQILELRESSEFYLFNICVSLAQLLKTDIKIGDRTRDNAINVVSNLLNVFVALPLPEEVAKQKGQALSLSYLANSSRLLDGENISTRTMRSYAMAEGHPGNENIELVVFAGNISLQFGKQRRVTASETEVRQHFSDAINRFEKALSMIEDGLPYDPEVVLLVVAHSKLGEAYLRHAKAGEGGLRAYENALAQFEKAAALGNDSPELKGLMGDVYYRKGYWGKDPRALRKAIDLKDAARQQGHKTREAFSVTGRAREGLYSATDDSDELVEAVRSVLRSIQIDPSWPWPYFQLADFARRHSQILKSLITYFEEMRGVGLGTLVDDVCRGKYQKLYELGVSKIVDSKEFKRKILGGRSKVFVLDDPHKLIGSSIVLKPTTFENATRETQDALRISRELERLGLSTKFSVPTPISIIPMDEDKDRHIFAMAREPGTTLAEEILGESDKSYPEDLRLLRSAAEFLSLFQSALISGLPAEIETHRVLGDFRRAVDRASCEGGADASFVTGLAKLFPKSLPTVRKKDAHAENWIVSPRRTLVMIDLESTRRNPVLLDLAQLIEDYPAIALSNEGWDMRLGFVHEYWVSTFDGDEPPDYAESLYALFAIQRAVFGVGFCARRSRTLGSSSALNAISVRRSHFVKLLDFIAEHGKQREIAELASKCHQLVV